MKAKLWGGSHGGQVLEMITHTPTVRMLVRKDWREHIRHIDNVSLVTSDMLIEYYRHVGNEYVEADLFLSLDRDEINEGE